MGKYLSSTYELGDIKLKLISIDGEIFEQNRFEKNTAAVCILTEKVIVSDL